MPPKVGSTKPQKARTEHGSSPYMADWHRLQDKNALIDLIMRKEFGDR